MPLKAGGLGVDVLANPDHAAVAAMSSAVASLHAFARDVDNIGGSPTPQARCSLVFGGSDTHAHIAAPGAAAAVVAMMMIKRDMYVSSSDGALAVVPRGNLRVSLASHALVLQK